MCNIPTLTNFCVYLLLSTDMYDIDRVKMYIKLLII